MQKYKDVDLNLSMNDHPVCPHCGKENKSWDYDAESGIYNDSDSCELRCRHCINKFQCLPDIRYVYTTYVNTIDGDEV